MKHTNNLFKGFAHAYNGIMCAATERNVRVHLAVTVCVLVGAYILQLSVLEWALILSAIALVLITEFINTCIELICDVITIDYSIPIKKIKDIAAASVLLSAVYAISIAILLLYSNILLYI